MFGDGPLGSSPFGSLRVTYSNEPTPTPSPGLTMATITGALYNPSTGAKVTSGQLLIRPKRFILADDELVAPIPVRIDVPGTGDLNFQLVVSSAIEYIVEFDPDPGDSITPLTHKSGYFRNTWTITTSVNISAL